MPEETDTATDPESTSGEGASDDLSESNSDDDGADELEESDGQDDDEGAGDDDESDSEAEDESDETDAGDDDEGVQASDDEGDDEDPEYRNLIAKFKHITNPRDRRAAIGKTFWEKTRYASRIRRENEELKAKLAAREGGEEKPEGEPPPPPPDLAKAVQRIETLIARGKKAEADHNELIPKLNAADRELAIAEHELKRIPEGDDDRRHLAELRKQQAEDKVERLRDRFSAVIDRQTAILEAYEAALAEKDFIERFHKDQAQRKQREQQRHSKFREEFPKELQSLTVAAASGLKLDLKDKGLRDSLWRWVNRSLYADIAQEYREVDIEDIPIPEMVRGYVKEWAEDRDLAKRAAFVKRSKEKLSVTTVARKPGEGKASGKADTSAAAPKGPIPVALLSRSGSPKMDSARAKLQRLFGGGRG